MANRWFFNILHFRWFVVVASLMFCLSTGWGLQFLEMKSDYR